MLYLATFTLRTQDYPDRVSHTQETRLVRAGNETAAATKLIQHWESQSTPYGRSYSVKDYRLTETIE